MFAVLPAHPTQMPVLANNMVLQGGEDRPLQNLPQVIPIPKRQGGQVRVIAHLNSCTAPHGRHLGRGFFIPAAAAAAIEDTPACRPPSCDEVGQ